MLLTSINKLKFIVEQQICCKITSINKLKFIVEQQICCKIFASFSDIYKVV